METYLPSRFTSADYPRLIAAGQEVETIAVGAVMAVFNWEQGNPRHQKVSRFVDAFFSRFEGFPEAAAASEMAGGQPDRAGSRLEAVPAG